MELAVVVTSVQAPTPALAAWASRLAELDAQLLVIGDAASPARWELPGARFVPLAEQRTLPFGLPRELPEGCYARKNLGYLLALADGARCVYETDDDNAPGPAWAPREPAPSAHALRGGGWHNGLAAFTDAWVWPRGLPLERVGPPGALRDPRRAAAPHAAPHPAPVQQGLVDGEPDVDAVWRLLHGEHAELRFRRGPSLWFGRGAWTPIDSQSTWWWPAAFPLLYLPSTCSFRVTDIWRGLVALRCLWELDAGFALHAPEVRQARNPHDLLRDLELELPGVLHTAALAHALDGLRLEPGADAVLANQRRCWELFAERGVVDAAELARLDAWQRDVAALARG